MPTNIFINYRKDDSRWHTQALYHELLKYFPKESIFKDFNTIGLGDDYVLSINKALEHCDVLLVIIGRNWLAIKDQKGISRLWDPGDLVRVEIGTALRRDIKVIPVFFDDMEMFKKEDLPEDLQALTTRQSISVDDTKFDSDIQKLAEAINVILGKSPVKVLPEKKTTEVKLTLKNRLQTAAIVGTIGLLISTVAFIISISISDGSRAPVVDILPITAGVAGIAGVCWFLVGMFTGPEKKRLLLVVISSLITLAIYIAVAYKNYKTVNFGIAFVMSPAGLLVAIIAWLIQKMQVSNAK
jgi:hypothetical protein